MIFDLSIVDRSHYFGDGYIAGTGDGIVTVNGQPAIRPIYLFEFFDYQAPVLVAKIFSDKKGRYLFKNLDTTKQYLVMARDHNKEYKPFCFDYVTPATDLTLQQQQELWQSWQGEQSIQYSLTLNVTDNKQPSQTEVFLFNQADKRLIGKGMTNTDGKVTFYTTDNSNKYFAVSFYKNDSKRARIQDRLTPTAITN